jgi:hypothetical protein
MCATNKILALATISVLFYACGGGGGGKSQQVQIPDPPAAPVVSVSADTKQLIFSWEEVATSTHYRLLENPDGHSGFTQVGGNIPGIETSVARDIAVHLHDWVDALYVVQACNTGGCSDSTQVSAIDVMLDTIGYLKASNRDEGDGFGHITLSEDGKTLAVGVPGEDSSATGINGDQADNSAWGAGAVYLFRLSGSGWAQQAYIKASNTESEDGFGTAVALSADGSTLAVGARGEDSIATGVDGDQADNSASGGGPISAGAVYLYRYDGIDWYQQAYIKASNAPLSGWPGFGSSVALSTDGNTLAVGAIMERGGSTGINGDQNDDTGYMSGAVYLFRFDSTGWYQQAYIKASNAGWYDYFGGPLALSADGNTLAVGAQGESSSATGINGDQTDDSACCSGAVYLFRFDGMNWYQQAYVKASNTDPGDRFSASDLSLSADGDTLAVGATMEDSQATGINGDQYNDGDIEGCGAVYIFRFDQANWYQQAYVKASNTGSGNMEDCDPRHPDLCSWAGDKFGSSVAISTDGNTLAVGARGEDSSAAGVDGDQTDDSAVDAGAAYLFRFDGMDWHQHAYIKAPNTDPGDGFAAVALSGDGSTLVVGAPGESSSVMGINGNQADNSVKNSGAVYVY